MVFGCLSSFCFLRIPDTSRVPTEAREYEARERGNFSAPRLKAQVLGATLRGCQGRGGRPSPQAAWGGRAVSHPPAPPANNFEAPPASTEKERTGPRAHAACNRRISRRAPGASSGAQSARLAARTWRVFRRALGASSGAQTARLLARRRRVFRRATGASPGAQTARFPARRRRVFRRATGAFLRRATGASCDAQPARLATCTRRVFRKAPSASSVAQSARLCGGVRSICILNRSVLTLVLSL